MPTDVTSAIEPDVEASLHGVDVVNIVAKAESAARVPRRGLNDRVADIKVEVLDLFESSYGAFNTLAKKPTWAWCNTRRGYGGVFIR